MDDELDIAPGYYLFFPAHEVAENAMSALEQYGLDASLWPTDEEDEWLVLVPCASPGPAQGDLELRLEEIATRFGGSNAGWVSPPAQ